MKVAAKDEMNGINGDLKAPLFQIVLFLKDQGPLGTVYIRVSSIKPKTKKADIKGVLSKNYVIIWDFPPNDRPYNPPFLDPLFQKNRFLF